MEALIITSATEADLIARYIQSAEKRRELMAAKRSAQRGGIGSYHPRRMPVEYEIIAPDEYVRRYLNRQGLVAIPAKEYDTYSDIDGLSMQSGSTYRSTNYNE